MLKGLYERPVQTFLIVSAFVMVASSFNAQPMLQRTVLISFIFLLTQSPVLWGASPSPVAGKAPSSQLSEGRLASAPFRQGRHMIPAVAVSTKVLEMQRKGFRGESPGSAWPLRVTVHHLADGTGPKIIGGPGIGEDTVDALAVAVHAATHAVQYDERFVEASVSLDFEDSFIETPIVDGPSVGLGFAVAVAAVLLGDPFPPATCITGTITAEGEVGPVGGIYDKIEGCHFMYPRSRFVLPMGQRTGDTMSNAGRFGVALFEAHSLEDAYETVIGKPIRPVE